MLVMLKWIQSFGRSLFVVVVVDKISVEVKGTTSQLTELLNSDLNTCAYCELHDFDIKNSSPVYRYLTFKTPRTRIWRFEETNTTKRA